MSINTEVKNLASYVTFRQLYDDGKKDMYYIISKFAESIIISQNLYGFDVIEISEEIRKEFGFNIPDYVVQTSLKRLECLKKEKNKYLVDSSKIENNTIEEQCEKASEDNQKLVEMLHQYAEKKRGVLDDNQKERLIKDFCAFVLDESNGNSNSDVISAFLLENQTDASVIKQIKLIKEGAVLFAGINYNSNVSEKSAWEKEIVLFVETEILFHLAGYNGEVFQRLALDLFQLISEMNSKRKNRTIKIRYFNDVHNEIEDFFIKAEDIVKGNDIVSVDNYAMNTIVKGCKTSSDVIAKKSAFYSLLRVKGITEAEKYDYFSVENYKYNLESLDSLKNYQLTEDKRKYFVHVNCVNILRKGKEIKDLREAGYLVLTENGKILHISKDVCGDQMPLAVNMYTLTNRLWYDLNKGFGAKEFPANFDMLLKSKIVLSSMISQAVSEKFEKAKKEYRDNKIDADQMADIILFLREEAKKPEDIDKGAIGEVLDFISEEGLNQYQSEKAQLSSNLKSKVEELEKIKKIVAGQRKDLQEKDEKGHYLEQKNQELIDSKQEELAKNYERECKRKEKVDNKIKIKVKNYVCIYKMSIVAYYIGLILIFLASDANGKNLLTGLLAILPPMISAIVTLVFNRNLNILEVLNMFKVFVENKITLSLYEEYDIDPDEIENLKSRIQEM